MKASSENGIDDRITVAEKIFLGFKFAFGQNADCRERKKVEIVPCISLHILWSCEQHHDNIFALLVQLASDYESVPTVVAFAANHGDSLFDPRKRHQHHPDDGLSGILHQSQRRDSVLVGSEPVNLAHLGSGND